MTNNLMLTLADWTDLIAPVIIGAVFLGSLIGKVKSKSQEQRKLDEGPNAAELEQMAARRREQLRHASRGRAQASRGGDMAGGASGGGGEPGNLTMAERIARARAKAQYEQRAQASSRPAQQPQAQVPNEAQRRALAQRQAELDRRRQAARAQQQAQQRARQQAQQRVQQQAHQQRAQAHARAQAQARQRGTLIHENVAVPEPTESTTRRIVSRKQERSVQRPVSRVSQEPTGTILTSALSRNDLRKAIILNEVLGKPIALRDSGSI